MPKTKTFLLTSTHSNFVRLKEAHFNLWFFDFNKIYLDLGLLLSIEVNHFSSVTHCDFDCYTPFAIKTGTVQDLFPLLLQVEVVQLIFNDDVTSTKSISRNVTPVGGQLAEFRSSRDLLFLKVNARADDGNKLHLSLNTSALDRSAIATHFQSQSQSQSQSQGKGQSTDDFVDVYVRLRYQVDTRTTSNIYFERRTFHDQMHFDFRFNEPRLIEVDNNDDIYDRLIRIDSVTVFIVEPTHSRLVLEPTANRQYVRLLERNEDAMKTYMEELKRDPVTNYLVYQWSAQLPEQDNHFDMLVSFRAEKRDFSKRLNVALALAVIASIMLLLPQFLDTFRLAAQFGPIIELIFATVGGVGWAVVLGILGNAAWEFIKERLRGSR